MPRHGESTSPDAGDPQSSDRPTVLDHRLPYRRDDEVEDLVGAAADVRSDQWTKAALELVGAAGSERELWPLLHQTQPHVVLLDLHHPGRDGLSISLRIMRRRDAPAVVLYSATTDDA